MNGAAAEYFTTIHRVAEQIAELFSREGRKVFPRHLACAGREALFHAMYDVELYGRDEDAFDLLAVDLSNRMRVRLVAGGNSFHKPVFYFNDVGGVYLRLGQEQRQDTLNWLEAHNITPQQLKTIADEIVSLYHGKDYPIVCCTNSLVGSCPDDPCSCRLSRND